MKKLLLVFAFSFLLFSCSTDDLVLDNTTRTEHKSNARLKQNENVRLYSTWGVTQGAYGYYTEIREFKVEVKNLAYHKEVDVLCELTDGTWKFFPLSFSNSTQEGTEIWSGTAKRSNIPYLVESGFKGKYAVRYKVNGQEYWDNNNGQNYEITGVAGRYLSEGINVSVYNSNLYQYTGSQSASLFIDVDVKNLNYKKDVEVVYTTDGWKTSNKAKLNFQSYFTVGPKQMLISPNRFGVEKWSVSINLPTSVQIVDYAIVYRVNGQEYWDNNFGKNYRVTKVTY